MCVSVCVCECVCAVSYTHLDVYKRQDLAVVQEHLSQLHSTHICARTPTIQAFTIRIMKYLCEQILNCDKYHVHHIVIRPELLHFGLFIVTAVKRM